MNHLKRTEKALLHEDLQICPFIHSATMGRRNKEDIGDAWRTRREHENSTQNFNP